MIDFYNTIVKPIITEKTNLLKDNNIYVFEVDRNSNKLQVRKAVEKIFTVKVESVNLLNVKGKPKRVGKYLGRRKDWKKAFVRLSKTEKKDLYEGQ